MFVFLGRLHPIKRVDMTIEAFARAGERAGARPLRLLLLGQGRPEHVAMLKERAAALGVADRVIFAGWITNEEKLLGLASSDAFVLNSMIESFGYVLFEAIGTGTPPVVTENLSLATEITGVGAAVRATNSVDGLAAAIRKMASLGDSERAAMADAGFKWAKEEFSLPRIGRLLDEAYASVVDDALSRRSDVSGRNAPA
jgi:glycosyltransferase involved in cell wall biosynthesis